MIRAGLTFDDVLLLPRRTAVNRRDANVEARLSKKARLAIPLLSSASDTVSDARFAIALGKLGGLGVLHRNCSLEEQVKMVKGVAKAGVLVGAAVGPKDVARAVALAEAGASVIFIDCAHAHAPGIIEAVKEMKRRMNNNPRSADGAPPLLRGIKTQLVVGNIVTKEAVRDFAGVADAFKVGIGPGSICTTRIVSGVGVPQLTAIMDVVSVAKKFGIPVIADGGIRYSGDIVKALGAGASSVMLGSLFAGAEEAPGEMITVGGVKYKSYRGMGSKEALEERHAIDRYSAEAKENTTTPALGYPFEGNTTTPPSKTEAPLPTEAVHLSLSPKTERSRSCEAPSIRFSPQLRRGEEGKKTHVVEGVAGKVLYKGSLADIVDELVGGIKSGMGYIGAGTIEDIPKQAQFIQITNAGLKESHPHSIQ